MSGPGSVRLWLATALELQLGKSELVRLSGWSSDDYVLVVESEKQSVGMSRRMHHTAPGTVNGARDPRWGNQGHYTERR